MLPGVLFWRPGLDNFDLVKLTAVMVCAGAVAVLALGRMVSRGRIAIPMSPVSWAALTFVATMTAATLASDQPDVSLFGIQRRYNGLVLYACSAVLLLAVLRLFDEPWVQRMALALGASSAAVTAYGLLQLLEADPLGWNRQYGDAIFSTLGNPNFAAGYLGIGVPVLAWAALSRRNPAALRGAAALTVMLALIVIVGTDSDQGLAAGGVGLAVLALSWLLGRDARQRRRGIAGLASVTVLSFGVLVAGLLGAGPVARLSSQVSFTLRGYYWRAALAMFADNPVLGVGPDRYGVNYRIYRPLEAALGVDLPQGNDAAHNVLLHLLATGGLMAGLAYLAVVACTGGALVHGLRRTTSERRLLLGGVGGAWLAYQVQSLVSIDVPALASLHWLLAGAVVVLGAPPALRELAVPWAAPTGRTDKRTASGRSTRGAVVAAVAGLIALWAVTVPLRADTAAGTAQRRGGGDDFSGAIAAAERATSLAPWEYTYPYARADWLVQGGDPQTALNAFQDATERDPADLKPPLAAARVAAQVGQVQLAADWYRDALRIEPQHPQMKIEVARFLQQRGQAEEARRLLEDALRVDPDNDEARDLLHGGTG